jgi:hypothetical protein
MLMPVRRRDDALKERMATQALMAQEDTRVSVVASANAQLCLVVIGAQKGPTSAWKRDPPGFRSSPSRLILQEQDATLLLFLNHSLITLPRPGETESGSAGTQPGKG